MHNYQLLTASGLHFNDAHEALVHIGETLVQAGICRESYPAALHAREAAYPTGIALDGHCVAIPHCDASHALRPALYLIRPRQPVPFAQADDDIQIDAELIIALVVTHPQAQLSLLRTLFGLLQQPDVVDSLLTVPDAALATCLRQHLLAPAT